MSKIDWTPAKYVKRGSVILKDGHTMFLNDVVNDLNRRSFLELENFKLQKKIDKITEELGEYLKFEGEETLTKQEEQK